MDMVTVEQLYWIVGVAAWLWVSALLFIGTFVMYIAIMKMREVQDNIFQLHWPVRWVCFFILFVGLIFDTLLNWVVCSISYLELPKEYLTTARVVRHKYTPSGRFLFWHFEWLKQWRFIQSIYWCKNWLTPFDESHCLK